MLWLDDEEDEEEEEDDNDDDDNNKEEEEDISEVTKNLQDAVVDADWWPATRPSWFPQVWHDKHVPKLLVYKFINILQESMH